MRPRALWLFAYVLAALYGSVAHAAKSAPKANRIHMSEVAKRLIASDELYQLHLPFAEYFHQPKNKLFSVPARSKTPSAFERSLKKFWQPEALVPSSIHFERTGPLPARFPWGKAHKNAGAFNETSFFRGAVLKAAGEWADKDGYLDLDKLAHKFASNRYEQDVLKALTSEVAKDSSWRSADVSWNHVLEHLDQRTLQKITSKMARELVPKDMHALPWIAKRFDKERALSGITRVWARQHLLGNTFGFLEQAGIPAQRTDIWGKAYSIDPRIAPSMIARGYRVHGDGMDRKLIERQIDEELKKIPDPKQHSKPRFLILDDGGELLQIVAHHVEKHYPEHAHLFAGVEQTQGGINRLSKTKLPFSVIASGSSWGKKEFGSAMFGYAVAREIETKLESYTRVLARSGGREKQMTVLGYGEIGSTVAKHFKERGFSVVVYDPDPRKREQARLDGVGVVAKKSAALSHGQILVSAAGRTAFSHNSLRHLPDHALVFNAASSNELPRIGESKGGLPKLGDEAYLKSRDTGRNLLFKNPADANDPFVKNFNFIKDGGVINFPLEVSHPRAGQLVPGRYIQYQLGLLYLDLLSAAKGGHAPGMKAPALAPQKELSKFVEETLAETGESLRAPRWD